MICNPEVESERVERTGGKICDFFGILPSYHVWGEGAVKNHRWYHRLDKRSSISEMSLLLNFIEKFESIVSSQSSFSSSSFEKGTTTSATHVLMMESDASPLFSLDFIENKIESIIGTMKKESLDFVFVGRGCFNIEDVNLFHLKGSSMHYVFECDLSKAKKHVVDENVCPPSYIYETGLSRCCEAFIVSLEGIRKFLNHFHTYEHLDGVGKIVIDWELNHFFKVFNNSAEIKAGWHIPELFMQATPEDGNVKKSRVHLYL